MLNSLRSSFAAMRQHQWRLLHLLRSQNRIIPNHPTHHLHSLRSSPSSSIPRLNPSPSIPISRTFSSEPVLAQQSDPDNNILVISEIFSKPPTDPHDFKNRLDSNRVPITHDAINAALWKLDSNADVARRFFRWVLETEPQKLSSKSYNSMLRVLGTNGFTDEFWELVSEMKKKGYGVTKIVKDRVLDCFEKNGMEGNAIKLKGLFDKGSLGGNSDSSERIWLRVCKIVRHNVWSDDVEREIRDLNVVFSGETVKLIVEKLGGEELSKALIFFRWLEESGLYKHNECSYNVMARVLGREDSIDRFWKLVGDMRSAECEMEVETFVKVLGRFCKRRMVKDAVELYEFAMAGAKNKPSPECCTFLLRKVVACKELDMGLFSRVVKAFTGNGNVVTDSMVDAVLKSLTSVGRTREWNKVLKELEGFGFVSRGNLQRKIAYRLSASGNKDEASEFVNSIKASGSNPEHKTLESIVEGHCVAGNLDKAFDSFKVMVEKEGVNSASYAFDLLLISYCRMRRAIDASKILCQLVNEKGLKPRHSTYKLLVTELLVQEGFADALNILGLMRTQGFPPFTEPVFDHVSKRGSGEDAVLFLKAITSKRFPSTSVVLRMFDAFFKHGRHEEAQNFLSKCPPHIRNHADVLNLFCSMNSKEGASSVSKWKTFLGAFCSYNLSPFVTISLRTADKKQKTVTFLQIM